MIPVLFKANATDFSTYGIGTLTETTSCIVTEERNGTFECVLKYPSAGTLYGEIKKDRIIKAKPNDTKNPQAFRIYKISTPIDGLITVYAQHISYDLSTIGAMPFSDDSITPAQAMEQVLRNATREHNFAFTTDYSEAKAFSITKPRSIRACLGGEEGSVLSLWGGEYEWDNFHVIHHQGRGEHTDVVIEYGKNLTKLTHDTENTDVYTDLLPYAVITDEMGDEVGVVTLPEQTLPIADSTLLTQKTYILDMTEKFGDEEEITVDALREKALKYIENNPLGVDTPSITISFEPLWKQPEYAAVLERVSLCDTVTIKHTILGITAKAKVIKTVYDTLAEKYSSISLGSSKANLADAINDNIEEKIQNVAKWVDRFPSLMNSAIQRATEKITGQTGGYVVLHTASDTGEPYELLIMDTPDIATAVNVWRWNVNGLGFSPNGYNGPYETAITGDGEIVADFITSGTLVANIIKAGVLSSHDGSSYWNLETGEVVLRAYATTESIEDVTERVENIEEQKMYRVVINSSNGNIFKNGDISTVLTATVYSWDEDITDQLEPARLIWTRVSDDPASDKLWNAAHSSGAKSITITNEDVKVRATFCCDLIDTQ